MKRVLILVVIAMLTVPLFADEAVLIDFTRLEADITVGRNSDGPDQNRRTMMDFSRNAGASFTTEHREVMKTSLAHDNWEVILASSARNVQNMSSSRTRRSDSRQYGPVLGVRVHFPLEPHNSWAFIKPPFEIPAYEFGSFNEDGEFVPGSSRDEENRSSDGRRAISRFEAREDDVTDGDPPVSIGYGVVKNVGVIREVRVNVYGLNFPHRLFAVLIDSEGRETHYDMGPLNFDGWGAPIWVNPAYQTEVRNRAIRIYPLYPTSTPFVKFGGFIVQRDASHIGGDFIAYFKDVSIIYDKAVMETDPDIDNEFEWEIIETRENARKAWEMERFGQNQVLRYLEQQKQSQALSFDDPSRPENQPQDR